MASQLAADRHRSVRRSRIAMSLAFDLRLGGLRNLIRADLMAILALLLSDAVRVSLSAADSSTR